jgi:hypothetical protein
LGQKYFLGGVRSYMSAKLPFSFQVEWLHTFIFL